jgi:hypothetical protein
MTDGQSWKCVKKINENILIQEASKFFNALEHSGNYIYHLI